MRRTLFLILLFFTTSDLFANVRCTLNDLDKNVKRFFPASTSYGITHKTVKDTHLIENMLHDKFAGLYEKSNTPYTIYTVYEDKKVIGYIHGVNQKGRYGKLQVFLALDMKGKIVNFYYQELASKGDENNVLKSKEFADQFIGLTLKDFIKYDPIDHTHIPSPIENIATKDFYATLRAVKKNLIIVDLLLFKKM
ncbi:MAG: hypothetical protein LBH46_03580 [Rickettsiales bacterium]|jgi:hypothetical protein|nr:hypothetical protein [Rickettsiales bacterium]